jgi:hypothetical protein
MPWRSLTVPDGFLRSSSTGLPQPEQLAPSTQSHERRLNIDVWAYGTVNSHRRAEFAMLLASDDHDTGPPDPLFLCISLGYPCRDHWAKWDHGGRIEKARISQFLTSRLAPHRVQNKHSNRTLT